MVPGVTEETAGVRGGEWEAYRKMTKTHFPRGRFALDSAGCEENHLLLAPSITKYKVAGIQLLFCIQ